MRLVRPRAVLRPAQTAGASLGSYGAGSGLVAPSGFAGGDSSSSYYATTNNATIQGFDFPASGSLTKNILTVQASNVTIRNCRFSGDANRAVDTFNAGSVLIQDCTFVGNFDDAAVSGINFTVDRCEFSGMGNDAIKLGDDSTVKNSYIHSFNTVVGGHGDGIQGIDTPHRVQVLNCLIDIGLGGATGVLPNSAVIITPWTIVESGPANNLTSTILFDHCTFGGGQIVFHVDTGFVNGIWVTNCKFLSDYNGGPIQNTDSGSPIPSPATWSGNVKHDGVTSMAWTDSSA